MAESVKNVVLFGAGNKSIAVIDILNANFSGICTNYAVETKDYSKIGSILACRDGITVISKMQLSELYKNKNIDAVVIPSNYHEYDVQLAIEDAIEAGIEHKDILIVPYDVLHPRFNFLGVKIEDVLVPHQELDQIPNFGVHVVEHCNLRCKSCCNFSSLVEHPIFYNVEDYARDIRALRSKFRNIINLGIVGGEPLLHPDLSEIIDITRSEYKYADIVVATNGILLTQMSKKTIESLIRNYTKIYLSLYPPMHNKLDTIINFLNENGIQYFVVPMDKFFRIFHQKPLFKNLRHEFCGRCTTIRQGRIHKCIMAAYATFYNKKFGQTFPEDEGIDLYGDLTGQEILRIHQNRLAMCSHCVGRGFSVYPWEQGLDPKPEDWLLEIEPTL